jgi:predicted nucleic acid-binding protein
VAIALGERLAAEARSRLDAWAEQGQQIYVPRLLPFEFASPLTRARFDGRLEREDVDTAIHVLQLPAIEYDDEPQLSEIIAIAGRLARRNSYDAAYLELSQRRHAPMWTTDGSLYRNASELGFDVQLLRAVSDA